MNLEEQVCSLELSKKLKELGVKQESQFYWIEGEKEHYLCMKRNTIYYDINNLIPLNLKLCKDDKIYSAFTVAELGEILPVFYKSHKFFDLWYCEYTDQYNHVDRCTAETEADARAKMKIYLIENKLVVIE